MYSSTIPIPCNDTQCKKLQSLDHRANIIIKSTVTSIGRCLNRNICMLVKRCFLNELNLDTFNNFFEIFDHKMNTKNNNHSIWLPRVKLGLAPQVAFFAVGILYNSLPLELQKVDGILLFKRRVTEHFK